MTEAGMILGTAAYMSPEQARGKAVDQRTDVWAFGCVLYEMLTGEPAFLSEDVTSTLARVLEAPANFDALPSRVPPAARRTLELCLEKDARKRIADMRDVKLALAGAFATRAPGLPPSRRGLPIAASLVFVALLAGAGGWLLKPAPRLEPEIATSFDYVLPEGVGFGPTDASVVDIAPSGEFFAFVGNDGIYVRQMTDVVARAVPGTVPNRALLPLNSRDVDLSPVGVALSPDGREVAYSSPNPSAPLSLPSRLLKTALGGGAPVVLDDNVTTLLGLSWATDGDVFYQKPDGIWRVSGSGGTPEHVIKTQAGEAAAGPQLLPGGEWLLFTLSSPTERGDRWDAADIVVQSLTTGERRVLRSGGVAARYLPTGHLAYVVENDLFASTFDIDTLALGDEHVPLVQGVSTGRAVGGASYAVSSNGTLIFVPGGTGGGPARPQRSLVWVDREGNAEPLPVPPDDYTMARISPDGSRIALVVGALGPTAAVSPDIYVLDLTTENLTQLTFNPAGNDTPVWSRDSRRIFYVSPTGLADNAVHALSPDGGTSELVVAATGRAALPWSMSADGATLLLNDVALPLGDFNLAVLDIEKRDLRTLLDLAEGVSEPSLSPDGRWLASNESGDINIRPFPDLTQSRRSIGRGMNPTFSPDGSEIFFFDGAGLSVAAVQYAPFRVGNPRQLFRGEYWYGRLAANGAAGRAWDVDPKNDRFLMITMPAAGTDAPAPSRDQIRVVLNWFEILEQRVSKR
jgi:serine/threonine-protein kinase